MGRLGSPVQGQGVVCDQGLTMAAPVLIHSRWDQLRVSPIEHRGSARPPPSPDPEALPRTARVPSYPWECPGEAWVPLWEVLTARPWAALRVLVGAWRCHTVTWGPHVPARLPPGASPSPPPCNPFPLNLSYVWSTQTQPALHSKPRLQVQKKIYCGTGNFQQKKMYKGFISWLCLELIKINGKNKDLNNNNRRTKARDTVCASTNTITTKTRGKVQGHS